MTYQVLARKWRPRDFTRMVGQEHVLRALVNALDHDRLHHAFLFTGTRGVGKTTIARILAKCINCEQGVSSKPCGQCSACVEVDQGRFVDLIEVDAASRTKVEDTRELLENVQYAPTRGRYKVYLIDEVHMLSDHSFNALLKTLEEPPPHVKFLLATTDPQKLPVTVLSRCLQFNLKRLPHPAIADYLEHVLADERIDYEGAAVAEIARAAEGSMRDALSILDQAIAHAQGRLDAASVVELLGTIERHHVHALLEALVGGDAEELVRSIHRLAERAPDFSQILAELISLLHRIAVAQAAPKAADDTFGDREQVERFARELDAAEVQLFYQIALIGRRDLPLAPDPQSGFEMVMLRMRAFRPAHDEDQARPAKPVAKPVSQDTPTAAGTAPAAPAASPTPAPARQADGANDDWNAITRTLGIRGAARELAINACLKTRKGGRIRLLLDPSYEQLLSDNSRNRLQQALAEQLQEPVQLSIAVEKHDGETPAMQRARARQERQAEALRSIEQDDVVRDLQETFNAEIRPDMVHPVEQS